MYREADRSPRGRLLVLGLLACMIAAMRIPAAHATAEPPGLWLGDAEAPVPDGIRGGRVIRARQLAELIRRGGAVVVDVANAPRQPEGLAPGAAWLPVPHRGLPGALWIPGAGDGVLSPAMEQFYREQLQRATSGDTAVPLVLYCHARCWLSWNAAKRAIGFGYRRVFWFADGVEGWSAAGRATDVVLARTPAAPADAPAQPPSLVVLDLELTGDLGGPELAAAHAARLLAESARLRDDLARTGLYRIVDTRPAAALIDRLKSQQAGLHDCNGCDLDVGRALHADFVMVAWVDRVSGLILTLTYEIHDVGSGQIAARKSYDFRGDSDNAWSHAVDYMVRDIKAASAATPGQ